MTATSLAGISGAVTHAGLLPLGLTEWDTLASPALALLNTVGPVRHVLRLGTLRTDPGALRLLLTGGVVGGAALGIDRHVLAHVTTWRVLVTADGILSQLAVLITASISVLGAQQSSITLLVTLNSEIATERFLGLGEAAR